MFGLRVFRKTGVGIFHTPHSSKNQQTNHFLKKIHLFFRTQTQPENIYSHYLTNQNHQTFIYSEWLFFEQKKHFVASSYTKTIFTTKTELFLLEN